MSAIEAGVSWVLTVCMLIAVTVGVVYGAVMLVGLVQEVWRPLLGLHPPYDKTMRNIERLEKQLYGTTTQQQGEEKDDHSSNR